MDLKKAFEGRWRVKCSHLHLTEEVRAIVWDFFETGYLLRDDEQDITAADFYSFWDAYDKKVGKDKCVKLWAKLGKKDKEACMEYIPHYKAAQPDKQYRKNPETFLRNKSWNDEIISRSNKDRQRYDRLREAAGVIAGLAATDTKD